ncbi:MAG TPA: twin-arginine translocase TatA/TatE family subunit [Candidatus Hydrogenedentes bacterium]|nr:twin-arginine translocase TatA/TatE family subunit [Candidatus Hydrogenedentota bacterium]HOL76454.1 twin-arginine translocase TatA/TatE family subunit [Candidatus Hydrogenedentota bacterium]HPO85493.1 twin-arginine translocase TatA/TatE family subunit [Candidatus Hydrogenedentota bacterium]
MGSIGMGEIILLMAIALIVIGPDKFPQFAKIVIRTFRDLRNYVDDVKHELSKELRPVETEMRKLSSIDPENLIDALTGETEQEQQKTTSVGTPNETATANPEEKTSSPPPPTKDATSSYDSYYGD